MTTRRIFAGVVAILILVTLVTHARLIFGGETYVLHDHLNYTLPSRAYLANALQAGVFPQWWDGVGLGAAFAANPNHGALYPPAWIAAISADGFGADLVLLLHVLWLGIGVAWLARRWGSSPLGALFAGVAITAGGFTTSIFVNALPLLTFAWTPWVAAIADRLARAEPGHRWPSGAALCAAIGAQIMSGEPAGIITSMMLAGVVTLARAETGRMMAVLRLLGCVCFGLLLAAVVLWPAAHLLSESPRKEGMGLREAELWSLHPLRLVEWLWPRVLGTPRDASHDLARIFAHGGGESYGTSWALGAYVGLPVLIFAALAVRARGFLWIALGGVFFLLVALGEHTPLHAVFRTIVIPEQLVRYPERHIAGALVIFAALSGVGFTRAFEVGSARIAQRVFAWVGALLAIGVFTLIVGNGALTDALASRAGGTRPLDVAGILEGGQQGGALALITALAMAGLLWLRARGRAPEWAARLAVAVFALHMSVEAWAVHATLPRAALAERPALLADVAPATPAPRLYRPGNLRLRTQDQRSDTVALGMHHTVADNIGTRFGVSHFPGWDPALPARLSSLWGAASAHGAGPRLLWLYGIELVVMPGPHVPAGSGAPGTAQLRSHASSASGDVVLARNEARRPRAFVAYLARRLPSDDEVLRAIFANVDFSTDEIRISDATRVATRDATRDATSDAAGHAATDAATARAAPLVAPGAVTPCEIQRTRPEALRLVCVARAPGHAVLLDAWAPGWTATVDGVPTPIERADLVVRAVPIPAGRHVIEMRYETPGLLVGACISAAAWSLLLVAALGWLLRNARRRRMAAVTRAQ